MTDSPENRNELPPGVVVKIVEKLPIHKIFAWLFMYPERILYYLRFSPSFSRGVLFVVMLILFAGAGTTLYKQKENSEYWQRWGVWVIDRFEEFGIKDDKIYWKKPLEDNAVYRFDGYVYILNREPLEFDDNDVLSYSEGSGFWVTPAEIGHWVRQREDKVVYKPLFTQDKINELQKVSDRFKEDVGQEGDIFMITADNIGEAVKALQLFSLPVTFVVLVIQRFIVTMFYILLLTILPGIIRNMYADFKFSKIFAVNLHIAVPPIAIASVYSLVLPDYLDYSSIFVISFIVYIFYSMRRFKRDINPDV